MKNIVRYLNVILGCILIAISYNIFIIPNEYVSFGIGGLAAIIKYINGVNPAINILIINIVIILISSIFLDAKIIKHYILPSILIPVLIFLTTNLSTLLALKIEEALLNVLVAGVLSGYGYSFIYKQGLSAGTTFLLEELIGNFFKFHSKIYSWIIDFVIVVISFIIFGFEVTIYSLIIIFITKYMITKARFGINDSKMFYVITSKEKEVKNYIIHDLKYELTVLDVKGGFSKKQNQILLTVISSEDYFKLKEGIKIIDPDAFIAITDTYDVVNRHTF